MAPFVWKILLYLSKYKVGIVRITYCVIILFSRLFFLRVFPSGIVGHIAKKRLLLQELRIFFLKTFPSREVGIINDIGGNYVR